MIPEIHGPACPECGCECSDIAGTVEATWGKATQQKRKCSACGHQWYAPIEDDAEKTDPLPVQKYSKLKCPRCLSTHVHVTGQHDRLRYHRCLDCRARFKSIEE